MTQGSITLHPSSMKTLRRAGIGLALSVAFAAVGAHASEAKDEGFGSLTIAQVSDLVARKSASIYDNNGKDRWQKGHVPGAKWVAPDAVTASDLPADKASKLVFYCASTH